MWEVMEGVLICVTSDVQFERRSECIAEESGQVRGHGAPMTICFLLHHHHPIVPTPLLYGKLTGTVC